MKINYDDLAAIQDFMRDITSALETKCLLAGGAVRDMVLGLDPTDWDVYIQLPHDNKIIKHFVPGALADIGITAVPAGDPDNSKYTDEYGGGMFVWNIEYDGLKIQLIDQSAPVDEVYEDFGCSISMAAMNMYGDMMLAEEFVKSIATKTIVFDDVEKATGAYGLKIMSKFPGWTIDVKEERNADIF